MLPDRNFFKDSAVCGHQEYPVKCVFQYLGTNSWNGDHLGQVFLGGGGPQEEGKYSIPTGSP